MVPPQSHASRYRVLRRVDTFVARAPEKGNLAGRVEREKKANEGGKRGEEQRRWRSKEVSINNARPRLETWKTARLITLLLSLSCLRLYPYARQSGGELSPSLFFFLSLERSASLRLPLFLGTNAVADSWDLSSLCYLSLSLAYRDSTDSCARPLASHSYSSV